MYEELRKKLYWMQFKVLGAKATQEGKITQFDDEIYEKMDGSIIACFPVSFYIKHSKHMFPEGTCYDRSLYMFLALDDAILVRGNNLDLEYRFGKGHGGHGWVEVGDYVYDPSTMLKYDKDVFYKLYGTSNVTKTDKETYMREHSEFTDVVLSTDFNEFRPGGARRMELGILVRQVQARAPYIDDTEFNKDLEEYLALIEYDADQIQRERNEIIEELLKTKGALDVVSAPEVVGPKLS